MSSRIDRFITAENSNTIVWALIALLLLLGVENRFIQDDAFISFRYALNLVEGHGLSWNPGEGQPVEGYTNFLWVMLMALVAVLGLDPVVWSMVLGLFFGAGTLFLTYKLTALLLHSSSMALLSVVLLGTNFSFSSYMTGGLETQLQTFLLVGAAYGSFGLTRYDGNEDRLWLVGLSILFALAVMTRLDSALVCGALYGFILLALFKKESAAYERMVRIVALTLPGGLFVGAWLYFKLGYYGDILPNTYYVKALGIPALSYSRGLRFIWLFVANYSLVVFLCIGLFFFKEISMRKNLGQLIVLIGLWVCYIIKIGGGFMEFRFLVPILPFLFVFIAFSILSIDNLKAQAALVGLLLFASFSHAKTFNGYQGIESIAQLNNHVVERTEDWQRVGRVLRDLFGASSQPIVLATTAAGAIPYYSGLPTVDMLGLNDRWIARNGMVIGDRPGHWRHARLEYLLKANVNIVVGHPQVKVNGAEPTRDPRDFLYALLNPASRPSRAEVVALLPKTARIVELPLNANRKIEVLYLKQHGFVDETVERLGLKTYEILAKE